MLPDTDVIIVGGGPTGLLLAGDLAATGVSCALLERRTTESNLSRAFGVHARTLELLDARGVADELIATGVPRVRLSGRSASTFPPAEPFPVPADHAAVRDRAVARRRGQGSSVPTS